jgi:hypothetical protein
MPEIATHEALNAAPALGHPPPQLLFRALLEEHLMSFTQFAFGVIRPGIPFRPNWHLEAISTSCPRWLPAKFGA